MNLYLMRHGRALSGSPDERRPLSEAGREDAVRVAEELARREVRPARILHSGLRRARETAEIAAAALGGDLVPESELGLRPHTHPSVMGRLIERWTEAALMVGHLPHLERLTSLLVSGDPDGGTTAFPAGALACLSRRDDATWTLEWMITPGTLE